MMAYEFFRIGNISYEKVNNFKYLGSLLANQNYIEEDIKCRPEAENSCYYSVETLFKLHFLNYHFEQ